MTGSTYARVVVILLLVATVFAVWQYYGYQHERGLIEESLHQQAHSVINALVGGVNSHRRLGYFFDEQLQGMLDELVASQDVLAAAVVSLDGTTLISAGDSSLLGLDARPEPGDHWDPEGFRLVEEFRLAPAEPGFGRGYGRGYGRGRGLSSGEQSDARDSRFAEGGEYLAVLRLDRSRSDTLTSHAAWSHAFMALAGCLVMVLFACAWRASMRSVAARGQAQLLEAEAEHLRELRQAAAGLAHETRNPLGLIRGWTQRLADSDGDDELRHEHARAVIEECDRVTARINQFLAFAKPHASKAQPVALEQLVDELGVLLQPDIEAKDVTLKKDLLPTCAVVSVDRELLRQALFNLMQNAIQFAPPGSAVLISSSQGKNGTCCVNVCDRGPGVDAKLAESLFTPYVTTRSGGTGLGLAIVKKIAGLHGWKVRYHPRDGGGAVFALEEIHG